MKINKKPTINKSSASKKDFFGFAYFKYFSVLEESSIVFSLFDLDTKLLISTFFNLDTNLFDLDTKLIIIAIGKEIIKEKTKIVRISEIISKK